jgi:hypothetical protein
MMTRTDPDLRALRAAVAGRARAVAGAVQRMDGLLPEGPTEPVGPTDADLRALALRLLRVAGSPTTDQVLRAVRDDAARTEALAGLLGQDRLAFWETLADLVQSGLVEHEPERGTVRATAAGRAVLELVDRCVDPEEAP